MKNKICTIPRVIVCRWIALSSFQIKNILKSIVMYICNICLHSFDLWILIKIALTY